MADRKRIEKNLWELHEALIEYFRDLLTNHRDSLKGSTLDAIRTFLKDNSITRNELKKTKGLTLDGLDDVLEDWEDEIDPEEEEVSQEGKQDYGFKVIK